MNYFLKRNDAILLADILYLEAIENYTLFVMLDGSRVISSLTLKRHQENLAENSFLRINRSTLVNSKFVKSVVNKDQVNFIKLSNGSEFRVSRRRQESISQLAS